MAAAYGAAVLLNALSLRQRLALPGIRLSQVWRPAIVLAAMAAAVAAIALGLDALTGGLPARLAALITALPSVAAGVIVLATGLVAAGVIGPALWRQLPGCGAGTRMDARLKRLHTALRRRAASSLDNGKDDPL